MKKLFCLNPYRLMRGFFLLCLLVVGLGGVKADVALPTCPTGTLNLTTQESFTPDQNNRIFFNPKADASSATWWNSTAINSATDYCDAIDVFPAIGTSSNKVSFFTTNASSTDYRAHAIRFTGAIEAKFLVKPGATTTETAYLSIEIKSISGSTETTVETLKSTGSNAFQVLTSSALNASTEYVAYISSTITSNGRVAMVALKGADPDAAPTVSIPAQMTAYNGENSTITASITSVPAATSIKWYSCNADKSNASVKQDNATKTTFGFKPSVVGTRYYYCEVTNSLGTTESDVCEVTVVDRPVEYTFGTTRTLGGTTFANANTKVDPSADGVTVSEILSTYGQLNNQSIYHGSATEYKSDGAYRNATAVGNTTIKTQAGDADGAETLGAYLAFKLSVASGKMISITNIASDMYVGAKSNWYYEYVIENNNGTQIYKSPAPIKIASYNSGSGFSSSVPLNVNALKNLTGDVTVKLIWWINSGGTSMVLKDFNVTATVEDAPAVYYNIAYSKGDSDAEGTLPAGIDNANTLTKYLVPANATLYKAGYTLTGWTDGEKTYNVGESYEMAEGTHTLTPVFTANTESLNDFNEETIVIWNFGKSNGAPEYTGTATAQVKQVKVNATTVDLGAVMAGGDNSGRNDEWMNAQQKDITVPVCNGAVIETKVFYANDAVINGETQTYDAEKNGDTGNVKYTYTYYGVGNSVVVNAGNQFLSYIKVTYPVRPSSVSVTIGSTGYATYVTPYAMDFTGTDITAYEVKADVENSVVRMTSVDQVPANTAVVLKGVTDDVPVIASAGAIDSDLTYSATATAYDAAYTYYYLGNDNGTVCFRPLAVGGSIAAGKGFISIHVVAQMKPLQVVFEGENATDAGVVEATPAAVQNGKFATPNGIVIVKNGVATTIGGIIK